MFQMLGISHQVCTIDHVSLKAMRVLTLGFMVARLKTTLAEITRDRSNAAAYRPNSGTSSYYDIHISVTMEPMDKPTYINMCKYRRHWAAGLTGTPLRSRLQSSTTTARTAGIAFIKFFCDLCSVF